MYTLPNKIIQPDNDGFEIVDGVELMTADEHKKREEIAEKISKSMKSAREGMIISMLRGRRA